MANKKQVFVSYHYDDDRIYKNLLLAWDVNKKFDFHISDHSADISVESKEASTIKRVLSRKIHEVSYVLVIIGRGTKKSEWVKWEIEKAKELGKKIIAIKINRKNRPPQELYGIGAVWAFSFRLKTINNAIAKIE